MRAGKVASLYLVLILSVAATAVSFAVLRLDWFQEWSHASQPVVRLLVLWCIFVVVVSGVLLPLGIVTDRSLGKLRNYIEANSDSRDPRSPFVGPNCGSRTPETTTMKMHHNTSSRTTGCDA